MELTLDMDEVKAALRNQHPEIPASAEVRVAFRPGKGPGSRKNDNGAIVQPFVLVTFDLPEPKENRT